MIDRGFWTLVPTWETDGAEKVLQYRSQFRQPNMVDEMSRSDRNFLRHVTRLPCNSRCSVTIILNIEGSEGDAAKREFQSALQRRMDYEQGEHRTRVNWRPCRCSHRHLESSCFWRQDGFRPSDRLITDQARL